MSDFSPPRNTTAGPVPPRWLRPTLEFGPLVVFLLTQKLTKDIDPKDMGGLWYGTIALMAALSISVAVSRKVEGRWPTVPLITAVFALVMGGLAVAGVASGCCKTSASCEDL